MTTTDSFKPKLCVWELTLACCFSCRHCGSSGGRALENELVTEECLSVAEQLADLGCEDVWLIGGEVFMRPDWTEVARTLSSRGICVGIITNGYAFTEATLESMKDAGVSLVAVSIDGTRAVHDKYRQGGSFDRAFDALRNLVSARVPTSVISTLNGENAHCLPEMYELLANTGIYAWQLQACSPMGNAANGGVDFRFDPKLVISFVEKYAPDAPFALGVADNIGYFTSAEGMLRGNLSGKAVFMGCRAGLTALGIDSIGNVRGCESMRDDCFNEGNLREKTLSEIWNAPDAFSYNRKFEPDMLTGACSVCEYGFYCAGGCRSYNHFVHGHLYEAPRCARVDIVKERLGAADT